MWLLNNLHQIPRYGWLIAIIPGVLLVLLAEYISSLQEQSIQANQRKSLNSTLLNLSTQLYQELDGAIYFSIGLKAYIESTGGRIREDEIAPWLTNLQMRGQHIRNIGLAPNNRITYIYPREGNEAALGLYYPDHPEQWSSVKEVIESRQAKLVGPFPLSQGGRGFAYREPIYLGNDQYWGIISIVLNADTLLASLTHQSPDLRVMLKDEEANTFLVNQILSPDDVVETRTILLPGRQLSISVVDRIAETSIVVQLIRYGGWILGVGVSLLLAFALQSIRSRQRIAKAFHETQERFVRAFSFSPQGMAIVDSNGKWLEINPAFCHLLRASVEEVQQSSLCELFRGQDQLVSTFNNLSRQGVTPAAHEQFEVQLHLPNQEKLIFLVSMGICSTTAKTNQIVIQLVDISERIKLEKMKSELVSTISHELRTPITSIHGALSLVTRGKLVSLPKDVESLLQIAYRNSQRLGLLINDLLDMEKLLAGKMVFNIQTCRVDQLVEQSLKENQPYADNLGVQFQLIDRLGAAAIQVDPLRFAQVMSNLLSNAAKFSPKGGIVEVLMLPDNNCVRIEVKDKGLGIADEFKGRIFQKFSQADSSATRQKGGTGLGLAIVKEMVDRMGGRVGFESQINQGSTFYTCWQKVEV